jgi:nucleotide-binding universal stress UspA family protein
MCLLVALDPTGSSDHCVAEACMVAEDGARVVALLPLEVPLSLPLATPLPEQEALARETLTRARSIGLVYAVELDARLVRTRSAGEAIVDAARREHADSIVLSMPRGGRVGAVAEFVLRNAPCRVLVAAL